MEKLRGDGDLEPMITDETYTFRSPIGDLELILSPTGLIALSISAEKPEVRSTLPSEIRERLEAYFAGSLAAIDGIPIAPEGTPFQHEVWRALRQIPPGETSTYRQIAALLGRPKAVRAVARANATNPIAIVVPCHRVIGTDGQLRGYAYGIERKRWLLDHERAAVESYGRSRARRIPTP